MIRGDILHTGYESVPGWRARLSFLFLHRWQPKQTWILTQVQTELLYRRPHEPVILQTQYTRDQASVIAVCVRVGGGRCKEMQRTCVSVVTSGGIFSLRRSFFSIYKYNVNS